MPDSNCRLYLITSPSRWQDRSLEETVAAAAAGGVGLVQLRDKNATAQELEACALKLLAVLRPRKVRLIINDRVEVAVSVGADGVHLGQEDGSIAQARSRLGSRALIGRSTHMPEQILRAQAEGADYLGVGPVFETPTKPGRKAVGLELVRFAAAHCRIPFFAIGGIDADNVGEAVKAGAPSVAVVRAVMMAADPEAASRDLLFKINMEIK